MVSGGQFALLTGGGIVSFCFAPKLWRYMMTEKYRGKERMDGKTVIVTGATSGIGKATAAKLANRGARVILACRDMNKCSGVRNALRIDSGNKQVVCRRLDLASMECIRSFAKEILQTEDRIDVLLNNAGEGLMPDRKVTADGFEAQVGVNHLGTFLLTNLLLSKLKATAEQSGSARILMMTDRSFEGDGTYNKNAAHRTSKLALMLFTQELARRTQGTGVTVNAVHPGLVLTNIERHLSWWKTNYLSRAMSQWMLGTAEDGTHTPVYACVSEDIAKTTGRLFHDCRRAYFTENVKSRADARKVWLLSEKWTRLDEALEEMRVPPRGFITHSDSDSNNDSSSASWTSTFTAFIPGMGRNQETRRQTIAVS